MFANDGLEHTFLEKTQVYGFELYPPYWGWIVHLLIRVSLEFIRVSFSRYLINNVSPTFIFFS